MKTYIISLKRVKERYKYIQNHVKNIGIDYKLIEAIDGALLNQKDIEDNCDIEQVEKLRYWLTDGAIGCALSHLKAYEEFIKSNDEYAFIIEDDVVLPNNIMDIIKEIKEVMISDEVVLLYYTSFKPTSFSSINRNILSEGSLYYPMRIDKTITAAAYLIGRKAAQKMTETVKPIRVAADSWHHFYEEGCFSSFKVHYPSLISTKNFKSSIDYLKRNSMKYRISNLINKYKIPFIYQLVAYRRKKFLNSMLGHFSLTDDISPILEKIRNKKM